VPSLDANDATYEPKSFWEANTSGYIRWEIYQPDEPEILAISRQTTPGSVLELGCGAGRNTRYFATAQRYVGIDLAVNGLLRATERKQANSLGNVCADIAALPFPDKAFDLLFSDSTIQHVVPEKIGQCAAEMMRTAAKYIGIIEYTEEWKRLGEGEPRWFNQIHVFSHNYESLFNQGCELIWRADTCMSVHPARKQVLLFAKKCRL
jgi:ubiquinone/menaquinone biosynthesis C-methylase UbiE